MCRCFVCRLSVAAAVIAVALAVPSSVPALPQDAGVPSYPGGWEFTGQVGTGLSFYFRDQVADPAFSFSAGRFLSDSLQFETQLLAIVGPTRERSWVHESHGEIYSEGWSREQQRSFALLTRLNLHLGEGRARPYLSFGAGLGWGSEKDEYWERCFGERCDPDPPVMRYDQDALALATLIGAGVDIAISDRWRVRPEAIMPFLWGAPQGGLVTLTVGVTYSTEPRPVRATPRAMASRAHAGEPLTEAWRRVAALPLSDAIRVQVRRGTDGVRDGRYESTGSTLLGNFVGADDSTLTMRVTQGAKQGVWRIPRTRVLRIERGRYERNGVWEGALGGFAAGTGVGALMYLGSGGGEDHEIIIPASMLIFGAPAALVGAISDYVHKDFEPTELIFDLRLVVPG